VIATNSIDSDLIRSRLVKNYLAQFEQLLASDVYGLPQAEKSALLSQILTTLDSLHRQQCRAYANIATSFTALDSASEQSIGSLASLPYVAVRLFKHLTLQSIPDAAIFKTLYSSGTTSQQPAKVILDQETSTRQTKVLVRILQQYLGKQRLPMLVIDSASVLKDKSQYSARGAGIQGLAMFGRKLTYALNDNMQPDWQAIETFCEQNANKPVLIFGFTFMVWRYFVQALQQAGKTLHLPQGVLLHSGGWKKLEAEKVSNTVFKNTIKQLMGVEKIHNFYGMAEQVGSIFVECEAGHLHAPVFADVIARDPYTLAPYTLAPARMGDVGLLQVLSCLPTSYPGHSILTEDLGRILGEDDCPCGKKGRYFEVLGRLPKTEIRGCSDTHQPI